MEVFWGVGGWTMGFPRVRRQGQDLAVMPDPEPVPRWPLAALLYSDLRHLLRWLRSE